MSIKTPTTSPNYNASTHNLEWAILLKDDDGFFTLNHNIRILGRNGMMIATLVANLEEFSEILPIYRNILKDFTFKTGQSYSEFKQGDKLAKYGLTALIAGGAGAAAAKLGLFQIIGKFGKVIFLAVIAFFAAFWRKIIGLFSRSKS